MVANLHDLASCIKIMPTSGHHFTAQAPLFPVFLLGMLATEADHKQISKDWFEQVVQTPVRSVSVFALSITSIAVSAWLTNCIERSSTLPGPSTYLDLD